MLKRIKKAPSNEAFKLVKKVEHNFFARFFIVLLFGGGR